MGVVKSEADIASNLRKWDTSAEGSNVKVELERRAGRLESSDRYLECISIFQLSY